MSFEFMVLFSILSFENSCVVIESTFFVLITFKLSTKDNVMSLFSASLIDKASSYSIFAWKAYKFVRFL